MDSIGGLEKCPKTKSNFVMVLLEKANGILMESIVISVMVSIWITIVFFSRGNIGHLFDKC